MNQNNFRSSFEQRTIHPIALFLFICCLVGIAEAKPKSRPTAGSKKTVVINIQNYEFSPASATVGVGDTVVWKNGDITPHTATSKSFNSKSIAPNASWRFTATKKGIFPYICSFHPTMKGRLIVK